LTELRKVIVMIPYSPTSSSNDMTPWSAFKQFSF
jgi:hypothetical protein